MKLTTIKDGEVISVKDLNPGFQVVEVQSEEDVGHQQETEEVPF